MKPLTKNELYLFFSFCPAIGPKRFLALLSHFKSVKKIYNASKDELRDAGLGPLTINKFIAFRDSFDIAPHIQELKDKGIWVIAHEDFPQNLRDLPNAPIVLFGRGEKELVFSKNAIGVVGSRRPTEYGIFITQQFVSELVDADVVIVSGMAMGIDGVAHRETLKSNGRTIAVLGSGVDLPTPYEHRGLYREIIEKGSAVISEYPPGTIPNKGSFPARNRIISALSRAIVIPEATQKSGALITATEAFTQGKKVFSVPGPITSSLSRGTTYLLKNGGIAVSSGRDILEELELASSYTKKTTDEITDPIVKMISEGGKTTNELVRISGKTTQELSSYLSILELSGDVVQRNGKWELGKK